VKELNAEGYVKWDTTSMDEHDVEGPANVNQLSGCSYLESEENQSAEGDQGWTQRVEEFFHLQGKGRDRDAAAGCPAQHLCGHPIRRIQETAHGYVAGIGGRL
jgi:hypothetical protein